MRNKFHEIQHNHYYNETAMKLKGKTSFKNILSTMANATVQNSVG